MAYSTGITVALEFDWKVEQRTLHKDVIAPATKK